MEILPEGLLLEADLCQGLLWIKQQPKNINLSIVKDSTAGPT